MFNFLIKSIRGLSSLCFIEKIRGSHVYLTNSFSKIISCPYIFLQVAVIQRPWERLSCQIQLPPFHAILFVLCCIDKFTSLLQTFCFVGFFEATLSSSFPISYFFFLSDFGFFYCWCVMECKVSQ